MEGLLGVDPKVNLATANVMLVDPRSHSMNVLLQIFRGFGVGAPLTYGNAEDALAALDVTAVDLIVVEADMPGTDGYGFTRVLRHSNSEPNRHAPVIIAAGHTPRSKVAHTDCGANFVIAKALDPKTVLDRIIWIAEVNRPFIEANGYIGPERRIRKLGAAGGDVVTAERRLTCDSRRSEDVQHLADGSRPSRQSAEGKPGSIKRIYRTNRLTRFFGNRDGKRPGELLAAANANLDSIRAALLVEIGAVVERIQQFGAALRRDADPAKARQVYDLSNEICGIAGACGLVHLGKAAYSFCELLDRLGSANRWNWPAIQVHLDAIQILRVHGADQGAVRDTIIAGLTKVVSCLDATSAEKPPTPMARPTPEAPPWRQEP